jgi:LysM repeat protein
VRPSTTVRRISIRISQFALAMAVTLALSGPALAQSSGFTEESIPASPPRHAAPAAPSASPPATASYSAGASLPAEVAAQAPVRPAPKPHRWVPYTVRPGDTLGTVAAIFGVTPEELARANRMGADDGLIAGATLRIPNPFTNEVKGLSAQVDALTAEAQTSAQKVSALETQLRTAQDKARDLSSDNDALVHDLRALPWWRASAVSAGAAALLMFGVMVVTLFEWWRMRRRFVALAELADSLGRLDYKYKALLAKSELKLQQLYGRRRQGLAEGQPRPKLSEEAEIERLNLELKELLHRQLVKLGARPRGEKKRARWRDLLGGVDAPAEARSARR